MNDPAAKRQDEKAEMAQQQFRVGDVVTIPAARQGEYTGTFGTVAGRPYLDPSDHTPVCLVRVLEPHHGPAIVFAIGDLHAIDKATIAAAISELVTRYGYRDITALMRQWYQRVQVRITFRYVLQRPDGTPLYCQKVNQLFQELVAARAAGKLYDQCPAPDPYQPENIWLVMGDFSEGYK